MVVGDDVGVMLAPKFQVPALRRDLMVSVGRGRCHMLNSDRSWSWLSQVHFKRQSVKGQSSKNLICTHFRMLA